MAGKKHTPEQIVTKLREAEKLRSEGAMIGQAARKLGVTEQTLHRWKDQYGDLSRPGQVATRAREREPEAQAHGRRPGAEHPSHGGDR